MKVLTLNIKQKFFDEIKTGRKTVEEREIRPSTINRYVYFVDDETKKEISAKEYMAQSDDAIYSMKPIKYDALKLITGAYNAKHRPYMVVEIKNAEIFFLTDENNEVISYEVNGNEMLAAIIDYTLGKVLSEG